MEAEIYSETPVTRYQSTRHHNLISTAATVTWYRSTSVWKKTYLKWLNTNKQTNKQHSALCAACQKIPSPCPLMMGGWVTEFHSAALRSRCGHRKRLPVHLIKSPTDLVRLLFPISNWAYLCSLKAKVVPWLRLSVNGLASRRPGFDPRSIPVGFVLDQVALRQVSVRVLRFYPVGIIAPLLHARLLPTLYNLSSRKCR